MRIKAGVHAVPGIAQTLKGQIIMGRMEVAMEGRREARRQAGHAQLPGVSAPLSVCAPSLSLLFQQTSSFSSSGEALWEIQNESDSSFAFLPSSLLSKFSSLYLPAFPVSLSLCPSLCSVSLCLSPQPQVYVPVSLSPCLPRSLPHSLLCLIILIIVSLRLSPGCLAVATPHEVTTLSHTHIWMPAQ